MIWLGRIGLARFHQVLRVAVIGALLTATASAAPPSNPAFLGIKMLGGPAAEPGCIVDDVTPGGAAEAAHVRKHDVILALDDVRTGDCTELTAQIIAHQPGDNVKLDILRRAATVQLNLRLRSRAEVLQRKFVGAPLQLDVGDAGDAHPFDLAQLRGETRVLAWFGPSCDGCADLIEKVASKAKVIAVTHDEQKELERARLSAKLGVPVAIVSVKEFDDSAMNEDDRAYFMVIDCRGIVRFVLPIVPDADDADAAVDEVLAAVEQADHARARR